MSRSSLWPAAALGATICVLLVACGGGTGTSQPTSLAPTTKPLPAASPQPSPTAQPAPTATPALSRQLRVALAVIDFQLLPTMTSQRKWQEPLYDAIVGATAAGQQDQSGVATSWESSPDAKAWTVHVRKDAFFHNGDRVTSADVKFTLDFTARPESVAQGNTDLRRLVTGAETPDDATVVFRLSSPNFRFTKEYLSPLGSAVSTYLLPKGYIESVRDAAFNKGPVGSGPYKLKKLTLGSDMTLEAVQSHWYYKSPRTKTLEFLSVPEQAARLALLKSGRAEIVDVDRAGGAEARKTGLNVFVKEGAGIGNIFLHEQYRQYPGGNPLSNVKVREALSIAIDRQAIVDTFLLGLATPTANFPLVSWDPAYKKVAVPKFDPVRARQLLKDAGYPDGFPLDVVSYPFTGLPESQQIMEAVSAWWEQIGVKVARLPRDFNAFRAAWYAQDLKRPTASGVLFISNRTVASALGGFGRAEQSRTFEDAELEQLGAQWKAASTDDEYGRIGLVVQEKVAEKWLQITMFEAGDTYAADPQLGKGWELGKFAHSIRINPLAAGS